MKTCKIDSAKLSALADGELSGWAGYRLRRHIARCADCARVLKDWNQMNTWLRAADAAPHPAAYARVTSRHPRSRFLIPGLIGSAATAAVAFGVVAFAPGLPGNPTNAYAEVADAMRHIRNAHWKETQIWFGTQTGTPDLTQMSDVYARLDTPTIVWKSRLYRRQEASLESVTEETSVKTEKDFRTYHPTTHEIIYQTYEHGGFLRAEILSRLSLPYSFDTKAKKAPTLFHGTTMTVQQVILQGHPASLIRLSVVPKRADDERFEDRLWADSRTHRLLRTDQREYAATGVLQHEKITEGFRYDESLPASAFTLNAPAGTPAYHENYWLPRDSKAKISPAERFQIERLIAQTYHGLQNGDWGECSAGWDFDYAASLSQTCVAPGQQQAALRKTVAAARGEYTLYVGKWQSVNPISYLRVMGYGDVNLPADAPPLLAVAMLSNVGHHDGFGEGGSEIFYIRRTGPDAPRIVGWQIDQMRGRAENHREWREKRSRNRQTMRK